MDSLETLVRELKQSPSWKQKTHLNRIAAELGTETRTPEGDLVRLGDDAAAIPHGDEHLLLASELILPSLVRDRPALAGRSAVLANVNDIYAMGGRPIALQDVILSPDLDRVQAIQSGLREASDRFGLPIVGGHLTVADETAMLGAFVLGSATRLLSCFHVQPGDRILMAVHLEGSYEPQSSYWNGTEHLDPTSWRDQLELLPKLAEQDRARAARDISMAGVIGSALMLLEPTGLGANLRLNDLPRPPQAEQDLFRWLTAFPSFGFLLTGSPDQSDSITSAFRQHGIACNPIGEVRSDSIVELRSDSSRVVLWDFERESFTGFGGRTKPRGNP